MGRSLLFRTDWCVRTRTGVWLWFDPATFITAYAGQQISYGLKKSAIEQRHRHGISEHVIVALCWLFEERGAWQNHRRGVNAKGLSRVLFMLWHFARSDM